MVVVKCWQILERTIVLLFAPLLSNEHSKKHEIPAASTPSPLCLDDPRGFGGNGRQWAKWSAREKWLRAAKTAPQLKIFFWKDFFSNTTNNASCWDIHSNHFDLFLFFHWWLIGGAREMKICVQGLWDWECHCPVSTTQPHSSLSLPCFFYSPFLSCEWCRSMRIRVVQTARWLCDQH